MYNQILCLGRLAGLLCGCGPQPGLLTNWHDRCQFTARPIQQVSPGLQPALLLTPNQTIYFKCKGDMKMVIEIFIWKGPIKNQIDGNPSCPRFFFLSRPAISVYFCRLSCILIDDFIPEFIFDLKFLPDKKLIWCFNNMNYNCDLEWSNPKYNVRQSHTCRTMLRCPAIT